MAVCLLTKDAALARYLAGEANEIGAPLLLAEREEDVPPVSLCFVDGDAFRLPKNAGRVIVFSDNPPSLSLKESPTVTLWQRPFSLPRFLAALTEKPPFLQKNEEGDFLLNGTPLPLKGQEKALFTALYERGKATANDLAAAVWGEGEWQGRVRVSLCHIRKKLDRLGARGAIASRGGYYVLKKEGEECSHS